MIRALLLGCGGTAGRNWVKCIKMGDPEALIVGVDMNPYNLAMSNADIKVLVPTCADNQKLEKVLELAQKYDINYFHAQPDKEVRFLAKYQLSSADLDTWYRFYDKLYCQENWGHDDRFRCKLFNETTYDDFEWMRERGGKVWMRAIHGAGSKAALPVYTIEEAIAWANYWEHQFSRSEFMLSEFLPGKEYAVQFFLSEGSIIHAGMRERVEYFFGNIVPSGQTSTPSVARSVLDVRLLQEALSAILHIDPEGADGIYCVDLKVNVNREYIPMEVNYGRFFTTSDFMASIGLNTPYEVAKYHITKELPKARMAPAGYYWLRGLDQEPYLVHEDQLWQKSD